jgi:hypothetical protein
MLSTTLGGVTDYDHRASASVTIGGFAMPVMMNDNRANDQQNPVIIAVPNDGLFAVWQDPRSGNDDIYTARSSNNGSAFLANKRADDSVGTSKQIEPAAAVSGNGTLYIVWQDNRRSTFDYDIYMTRSFDNGATFTKNIRVDDPTIPLSWQERPSVAVTNNGAVYVAWTDDRSGHLRIRGAYSTDWGATFSASREMVADGSTSGQDSVTLASSGNRMFAVFMDSVSGVPHPYVCVSTNGGKTFSAPARLDGTGDPGFAQRAVTVASMPGAGVVAAWEDNRSGNWDIYMSTVSSRGIVTRFDIPVSDDTTGSYQSAPSVASDQLGNIYAAWLDERNYLYTVRFAYMIAGAASFNASIAVSTPGPNDVQRSATVISPQPGLAYVVWQDDRLQTYDVYCSSAYFPDLFGLSLLDGWNFISIPSDVTGLRASTLGLRTGDIISSWNSSLQSFAQYYVVGVSPPIVDFPLIPSDGYWINTGSHENIKLKNPVPTARQTKLIGVPAAGGWVVVGFESLNTSRLASDIPKMLDNPANIVIVAGYDALTGSYVQYASGLPFTDFVLSPGQAYWCWCKANSTLTYSP